MAQYKIGSASVTNGSATVTGVDTLWSAEVSAGDIFTIVGDNAWYEVGSVGSNTSITLTSTYAGSTASGAQYAISRDFTTNKSIPYPQKGDIETASLLKRAMNIIDTELSNGFDSSNVTITGGTIDGTTIGGTTAAAVSATTLTTSSTVTHNGGTANSVCFLNGSKVLTTGSALTFDGTTFTSNTAITKIRSGTNVNATFQTSPLDATGIQMLGVNDAGNAFTPLWFSGSYLGYAISGSEQMRLTSTGLGIGTSSPSQKLSVAGNGTFTGYVTTGGGGNGLRVDGVLMADRDQDNNITLIGGSDNTLRLRTGSTTRATLDTSGNLGLGVTPSAWSGAGPVVEVGTSKGNAFRGAGINDANVESNAYYNAGWKYANTGYANRYAVGNGNGGGHYWYNAASGTAGNAITFTQAMTLDASGNLLVGTTNSNITGRGPATIVAKTNGGDTVNLYQSSNSLFNIASLVATTSGTRYHVGFGDGTTFTERGTISTNGTGTTYGSNSDYRLKENIAPMVGALEQIALLKPCTYTWKETQTNGQGFIAHELQEVCPDAVVGEKDGVKEDGNPQYQQVDTSYLVATLTAAIQEQQAIIESLKARLDAANL